ncbi:MAG: TIGR03936 family radical SAM-associated protein [Candidatus Omnitrophota bacterium]
MYKISFIFAKTGKMKYISHLDLMRLLTRAMRRADLPLKLSEGFSPHAKLSIKRALKLGLESHNEEASVGLSEFIRPQEFQQRLARELPEGITLENAQRNFN